MLNLGVEGLSTPLPRNGILKQSLTGDNIRLNTLSLLFFGVVGGVGSETAGKTNFVCLGLNGHSPTGFRRGAVGADSGGDGISLTFSLLRKLKRGGMGIAGVVTRLTRAAWRGVKMTPRR
jgi:hypothetical protein